MDTQGGGVRVPHDVLEPLYVADFSDSELVGMLMVPAPAPKL